MPKKKGKSKIADDDPGWQSFLRQMEIADDWIDNQAEIVEREEKEKEESLKKAAR